VDQFSAQKIAFQITLNYHNQGYGVEMATRNAVADMLGLVPWITPWEAGKMVDRAWVALEKQADTMRKIGK